MNDKEELHCLIAKPERWNGSEESRVRTLIRTLVPPPLPFGTVRPFYCPQCKAPENYLLFHGYLFGDRLLEGVMFEVRRDTEGHFQLTTPHQFHGYMNTLNEVYWLGVGTKAAARWDLFTCPTCRGDVSPEDCPEE